jgi:hypothetical protein
MAVFLSFRSSAAATPMTDVSLMENAPMQGQPISPGGMERDGVV